MAIFTSTLGNQSWTEEYTVKTEKVNDFISEIKKQITQFLNSEQPYAQYPEVKKQLNQLLDDIENNKLNEQNINEKYMGIWWPRLSTDKQYIGLELYNDDNFAYDAEIPTQLINYTKTLQTPEDSIQNPNDVYSKTIKTWRTNE